MLTHAEPPPRTESGTEWRLTGKAGLRDGKKEAEKKKTSGELEAAWLLDAALKNDVTG